MGALSISETQFAFAYFHKFAQLQKEDWYDFVFPTLAQEGDPTGNYAGADLVISKNVFVQFKVPEILWTRNTNEFKDYMINDMAAPYFRNYVKNILLQGKPNSGQFDMLRNLARSGMTAQYIFPVFDFTVNSDDPSSSDYWFKSFFLDSPSRSLKKYCISVDFRDLLNRTFNIGNDNSHTICYDYEMAIKKGKVLFFSEPKEINCSTFSSGFTIDNEKLSWSDDNTQEDIAATIARIKTIIIEQNTGNDRINEITTIRELQAYLIGIYNIFWSPMLKFKNVEQL